MSDEFPPEGNSCQFLLVAPASTCGRHQPSNLGLTAPSYWHANTCTEVSGSGNYWRHYQRVPGLNGLSRREFLLITVLAAGAAMELRLDPTPFAWVGW